MIGPMLPVINMQNSASSPNPEPARSSADLHDELIDVDDLARITRRSPEAIHVARLRAPHTLPPGAFKIARRVFWRRSTVEAWFAAEEKRQNKPVRRRKRPDSSPPDMGPAVEGPRPGGTGGAT